MKILFLRGQVPQDRDPNQIVFDNIEEVDDVWTQLAYSLSNKLGYGEIWYWDGKRNQTFRNNFVERWIPNFKSKRWDFDPDVIFARGGFKEYDQVLKRFPRAYKIYYGAGKRFYPQYNFKGYDLILNDTKGQVKKTKKLFPKSKVLIWSKPAAENIFRPIKSPKKYDVIMVGNENKKRDIKGHSFAIKNVPKKLKFIKVGIALRKTKKNNPHINFAGWITRQKVVQLYSQSKIAIVCCTKIDSCPRVIPEALACGCPLLILDRVNFWKEKYITSQSGKIVTEDNFSEELLNMVDNYQEFLPYEYYKNNLSLDKCSNFVCSQVIS